MTYATTFSGIGGWELGLNACGWDLKWQCECDPFCRALLKERFGVPIYDDIRTICEHNPAPVDALIGSPPCQPFSVAGPQDGTSDERHLYPAFLELVGAIKPRWVLMEQVPAILTDSDGGAFGQYVGGLAALGFHIVWHCIPACAIGADHVRDRVWIIAHSDSNRGQGQIAGSDLGTFGQGRSGCSPDMLNTRWRDRPLLGSPGESILCRKDDGVPNWSHRIKGIGNAVIPQIPHLIGQAINQIESITPCQT